MGERGAPDRRVDARCTSLSLRCMAARSESPGARWVELGDPPMHRREQWHGISLGVDACGFLWVGVCGLGHGHNPGVLGFARHAEQSLRPGHARVGLSNVTFSCIITRRHLGNQVSSHHHSFRQFRIRKPISTAPMPLGCGRTRLPDSYRNKTRNPTRLSVRTSVRMKDARITYRRRHSYRTKSNKVRPVKTPGKKPLVVRCTAMCGRGCLLLCGVPSTTLWHATFSRQCWPGFMRTVACCRIDMVAHGRSCVPFPPRRRQACRPLHHQVRQGPRLR